MSPPASPTGSTQPSTTSSTTEGSERLRALIAPSACVASASAVTSCSEPSALPLPRGVRTASYTNAAVIEFSFGLRHARPCAGHPRLWFIKQVVDGRDKPGHDGEPYKLLAIRSFMISLVPA